MHVVSNRWEGWHLWLIRTTPHLYVVWRNGDPPGIRGLL